MKIGRFGVVSGMGWLIDFTLFVTLSRGVVPAFYANLIGAATAITFVFFMSTQRVFHYEGGYVWRKLAAYLAYQAIIVTLFSGVIQLLVSRAALPPAWAKVLVTPVNFYANFLFMSYLLTGRVRAY